MANANTLAYFVAVAMLMKASVVIPTTVVNVLIVFYQSPKKRPNKFDQLFLANLSSLVLNFQVRPNFTQVSAPL